MKWFTKLNQRQSKHVRLYKLNCGFIDHFLGTWRIMFEHKITDDTFIPYEDQSDVMNRNTNDGLYSALSDMESMRQDEGEL